MTQIIFGVWSVPLSLPYSTGGSNSSTVSGGALAPIGPILLLWYVPAVLVLYHFLEYIYVEIYIKCLRERERPRERERWVLRIESKKESRDFLSLRPRN